MIVLRRKSDKRAINVSYTEVGALFSTDTSGILVGLKSAKICGHSNGYLNIEGDTTMSNLFYLEEFNPITFLTSEEEKELQALIKLASKARKKKERLSKEDFFLLKDLSKKNELQEAELAASIKARRMNYPINRY